MPASRSQTFARLTDGTTLLRQPDGSYKPVRSKTDHLRLKLLSEDDIELMAESDPDHPALDDAFWTAAENQLVSKEAISIKLDGDILSYFRQHGRGYQTRINAVLRRYVDAHQKARR